MNNKPVIQDWVSQLSYMQQSVLLCSIRGPDGFAKHHACKPCLFRAKISYGPKYSYPTSRGRIGVR